jgi:SAM-dependent methyltransferase
MTRSRHRSRRTLPGGMLFLQLLRTAIVADPEIERILTRWREAALRLIAAGGKAPSLPFLCALAEQCFATEFAYAETGVESEAVARLEAEIAAAIAAGRDIAPARLALLAAYRPLHGVPGSASLAARTWAPPLDEIFRHQVAEPLEEQRLKQSMPVLTDIRNRVSHAVRNQYEENPYPRWRNGSRPSPARGVAERFGTANPEILIAGCGTGQHPAQTAMRFPTARILAIDLSLTSLAYAQRRTRELGLTNLEYAQADILELHVLRRGFDIVESIGVLHHLDDPLAGWRVLAGLAKPGGMMLIGLYSDLARRPIVEARRFIAGRGFDATPDGIRAARQAILAEMDDSVTRRLRTNTDFFSLSGCRDLLFHAQEHRFTIPQIAAALDAIQLAFLGFDSLEPATVAKFRARFRDDPDMRFAGGLGRIRARQPGHVPEHVSVLEGLWSSV